MGQGYFILIGLWIFRFQVVALGYFILIGLGLFYFNWVWVVISHFGFCLFCMGP